MADQWFYRMFGEEFGPMAFEKLKELAEAGTLTATDDVRSGIRNEWVNAGAVEQLEFAKPEMETLVEIGDMLGSEPAVLANVAGINDNGTGNDEWFCLLAGAELGPMTFDELSQYAECEQISADDQVKLGAKGKWRRVGSIGRLMALLPYRAVEKKIVPTPPRQTVRESSSDETDFESRPLRIVDRPEAWQRVEEATTVAQAPVPEALAADPQAAYHAAYEQAKARIAESMIAQAEASFKTAEEEAKSQVAWALAPNVDRYWWGWAGGAEFGPVDFNQVFGLAKAGQLRPTDFIRNGQFAQYSPASSVPGMFSAVALIAKATETLNLAKSQAQTATALASPPLAMPLDLLRAVASEPVSLDSNSAPTAAAPSQRRHRGTIRPISPSASNSDSSLQTATRRDEAISNLNGASWSANVDDEPDASRTESPTAATVERRASMPRVPDSEHSASYSAPMARGYSLPSASSMATQAAMRSASRIKASPQKSVCSSGTWLSGLKQRFKDPKEIGSLCILGLIVLIFGWQYLPEGRGPDIQRYQAMKQLVDEVRTKRTSAPSELPAIQKKLQDTSNQIAAELKSKVGKDQPARQNLFWVARDEVPRWIKAGLLRESPAEKALIRQLMRVAYELQLEQRPPVERIQVATAPNSE